MEAIDPAAAMALLRANPLRIASATRGFNNQDLAWQPSPESWSVNQVVAHLRACADVWGESIAKILREDHPTFRYVSPRTFIRKTNYLQLDFGTSFPAFQAQRQGLLEVLQPLGPQDWSRRATVRATQPREETVLSYVQRLAAHEAGHCEQVERILRQRAESTAMRRSAAT